MSDIRIAGPVIVVAGNAARDTGFQPISLWPTIGLLYLLFSAHCLAADVAFSNDNQRIYAVGTTDNVTKRALREIDLSTNTVRVIPLRGLADHEEVHAVQLTPDEVRAVAPGDGGNILFITEKNVWAFDPRSGRATKLCSAPAGSLFGEIAYDAKSHAAYVTTTENGPLLMVKNGRDLVPVMMRRHEQISCLAFSSEGELFYKESGDLWRGEIKSNEDNLRVEAERYAAGRQLSRTAGPPEGLDYPIVNLAVARDGIYVQLWRYHNRGRGFGGLLKLPPPTRKAGAATYSRMGQLPVKDLGDTEYRVELGASADGSRVYYKNDDGEYLVTNGGTQKLQLRETSQNADTGTSTSVGANSAAATAEQLSSPGVSSDTIAAVGEREIDAISTQNIDALISFYADKVDLLDKGMVAKDTVRRDLQEYFDRWPITKWKLAGKINVKALNGSRYQVTFPVTFEVANPATNRRIVGTANETRTVVIDSAGIAKIVSQREKIIRSRTLKPDAPEETLSNEKGLKSENGKVKTRITFVNRSQQPVKAYWLDYKGERVLYKELKPSESYTLDTFVTHPWLITDLHDNAWDVYMPTVQPRTVIIRAPKKR